MQQIQAQPCAQRRQWPLPVMSFAGGLLPACFGLAATASASALLDKPVEFIRPGVRASMASAGTCRVRGIVTRAAFGRLWTEA